MMNKEGQKTASPNSDPSKTRKRGRIGSKKQNTKTDKSPEIDANFNQEELTGARKRYIKFLIFSNKHRKMLFITLSSLAVALIIAIIVVIGIGFGKKPDSGSGQVSGGADTSEYEEEIKTTNNYRLTTPNSEKTPETTQEVIDNLKSTIEGKNTPIENRITAVKELVNVYTTEEPKNYNAAIDLLNNTLVSYNLNSAQRLEVLYKLESLYRFTSNTPSQIIILEKILALPVDDSYPEAEKLKIDDRYHKFLEKAKGEMNEQQQN